MGDSNSFWPLNIPIKKKNAKKRITVKDNLCSSVIAAISPDLKRKAFDFPVSDILGATSEYCQMEDRTIVLTKFRCKNYNSLFIEKLVSEPSTARTWKKSFQDFLLWVIDLLCEYKQILER